MQSLFLEIDSDIIEIHKLWRYMDLSKFISLIEKNTLWLARADTFRDKREGRFPDDMRKATEKAFETYGSSYDSPFKDAGDVQDYLQKNTFISCWHKNFDENMVMWEIYGGNNNALAIQTTVEKIRDNICPEKLNGDSLVLREVIYEQPENISGVLNFDACFFIKRPHFSFENEVRISLNTFSITNPSKNTPHGYYLPININGFVEKILIHPDSPDWLWDAIYSITKKYEIHAPVERGVYGNQ